MLITLIQKEILHHILSVRFVALLLIVFCSFHSPYILITAVNYQESIKLGCRNR